MNTIWPLELKGSLFGNLGLIKSKFKSHAFQKMNKQLVAEEIENHLKFKFNYTHNILNCM
jgi:hypothetical protein